MISERGSATLLRIDVPNKKMVGLSTPSVLGAPLEKPMFREASLGILRVVEGGEINLREEKTDKRNRDSICWGILLEDPTV